MTSRYSHAKRPSFRKISKLHCRGKDKHAFHCTHVRMSYVLNSYLLTYLLTYLHRPATIQYTGRVLSRKYENNAYLSGNHSMPG